MGGCDEERRAVVIVLDPVRAEADLAASSISCPSCSSGRLRPWGYARARVLRGSRQTRRAVCPRRARCAACRATHVLVPADVAPRHADTLEVVVTALLAALAGAGHRTIAGELGVPAATVRSWLRRVRARAEWVRVEATRWAHRLDPLQPPIEPAGSALGDALAALGHAAIATRLHAETTATVWAVIGSITRGRLLTPRWSADSG
jgi:transposase-like protein